MQSTPSRARHSVNIRAPLINVEAIKSRSSKSALEMKKAIGPGLLAPPMASGTFSVPAASGGAGYDDQNNNGYRNGKEVGEHYRTAPTCETGEHRRRTSSECILEVFQMQ